MVNVAWNHHSESMMGTCHLSLNAVMMDIRTPDAETAVRALAKCYALLLSASQYKEDQSDHPDSHSKQPHQFESTYGTDSSNGDDAEE